MRSSVLPSWLDPGTRKGLVGAAALLWVMTVVAHLPALGGGFIFDDRMYITEDSWMDSLGGLGRIWTEVDPGCTRARDHLVSALEALDAP